MRTVAVLIAAAVAMAGGTARAAPPPGSTARWGAALDALGSGDPAEVDRAVVAITGATGGASDPAALFAAARACEDKLLEPARAAAIYERVVADHPTARETVAAERRIAALRALVGPHGETAAQASALARLIARADVDPPAEVRRRAEQLANAAWPGAPTAGLWLADWLRRSGRFAEAGAHYAAVVGRWPARPEAAAARRGEAGCALDAGDWSRAEALIARLPTADAADQAQRDDLRAAVARGRRRQRWLVAAWLAIAAAFAALIGSLTEAALRTPAGSRRSALRPPLELAFLGPVAAVLVGVAFTAHRLIAPAVTTIASGGLALTWLSGATLEQLRRRGRPTRLRGLAHVAACLVGVAGLGYVAVTRGGLLEMLIETVRFGPET